MKAFNDTKTAKLYMKLLSEMTQEEKDMFILAVGRFRKEKEVSTDDTLPTYEVTTNDLQMIIHKLGLI